MGNEIKSFKIISFFSSYIYMKEKYKSLKETVSSEDINELREILINLEKYKHLLNKKQIIEEEYSNLVDKIDKGNISDEALFLNIQDEISNFSEEEKTSILYSIIYVAFNNNQISADEEELIVQVSHILGFKIKFKKIMADYKKSDMSPTQSPTTLIAIIIAIITVFIVGIYTLYSNFNAEDKVNIFKKKEIVFSEISFNRYVIYKNKFNIEDDHFKKQAIFYISGSAEIGFSPKNIKYDSLTNTLTLYTKDTFFNIEPFYKQSLLVDEIKPKPISEEEAKKMGAVIGLVGVGIGGLVGNKVGSFASKVLAPPYNFVAEGAGTALGGIVGGTGAYFVSSRLLDGVHLSDAITAKEKETVLNEGKKLIKRIISIDESLLKIYKDSFEHFVKLKFAENGMIVDTVKYKNRIDHD